MHGQWIKPLLTCVFLSAFCASAHAQDKEQSHMLPVLEHTYSNDFCDFEVSFPDPITVNDITIPDAPDIKTESLSFVKTFGIDRSVRVRGNCKAITKDIRKFISQTSLDQELSAVERDQRLVNVTKNHRVIPEKRLRIASLSAERSQRDINEVFIYQIWVSDRSIFTFEAELTGPADPESDKLLVAILQSFKKK